MQTDEPKTARTKECMHYTHNQDWKQRSPAGTHKTVLC